MISSSNGQVRYELFIEAMGKLKEAALLMIIGNILASIGAISILPAIITGFHGLAIGLISGAVAIVGLIIILIALYMHVVPSFELLRDYKPGVYGTAATLVRIGYVWGAILLIIGIITLIIIIGAVLLIIGLILLLLGKIGVIIGMFQINSETGESMFLVTGILFLIGLFVPFLSFIGWIIIYIATDSAIARYKEKTEMHPRQSPESVDLI